jgi:hypothetical protein
MMNVSASPSKNPTAPIPLQKSDRRSTHQPAFIAERDGRTTTCLNSVMPKAVDVIGSELKGDAIIPFLVEVEFPDHIFLRVKESLTRIGIPGSSERGKPTLNQTCHVLSKRGKYYICHFKSLFVLDGKENTLTESDIARQNLIIKLLQDWQLVRVVHPEMIEEPMCSMKTIKIVKYQDRHDWILMNKYDVGACIRRQQEILNV